MKKLIHGYDVKIGPPMPINVAQFKRYQVPITIAHSFPNIGRILSMFSSIKDGEEAVFHTEVIDERDPSTWSKVMTQSKLHEIRGLLL